MGSESDERGTDIKLWRRRIITHATFPQMGALVARIGRIAVSWHRGSVAARAARSKAAAIMQAADVGTNSPAEAPLVRRFRGPTGTNHSSPCGSSGGKGGLGVAANEFWPRLEAVLLFRVVQGTTWEARHPGTQRKKVSAPNVVQKVKSARGVENAKGKDETRFERVTYRTAAGCSTPELFVLIELVAVGFANAPCKEGATIARTHFSSFHSLTTVNNCSNPSTPTFVPGHCHPINPAA